MPTPSVPAGYGRASLIHTLDGASHECVMTWHFADDPGTDPDVIAGECRVAWATGFNLATLADTWNLGPCSVLINRGGSEVVGLSAVSSNGTAAFEPSPIGLAVPLRKRTGVAGRAHRGRMWVPAGYWGDTAIEDDGSIDATLLSDSNDHAAVFLAALAGADVPMHLIGAFNAPVTSLDLAPRAHWLRKRAA